MQTSVQHRLEGVLEDNMQVLELAKKHEVNYILIDDKYEIDLQEGLI